MTSSATKAKVSVTLSPEVLEAVDSEVARHPGSSRSGVIESWLRLGSRAQEEERLRRETIAYYEARSREERLEDEEWATFASDELASVAEVSPRRYGDPSAGEEEATE